MNHCPKKTGTPPPCNDYAKVQMLDGKKVCMIVGNPPQKILRELYDFDELWIGYGGGGHFYHNPEIFERLTGEYARPSDEDRDKLRAERWKVTESGVCVI